MTRRTVVKSMNWLEANEVLTVQRVVGQSSRCSINIEWLKANQCQDFTREADSHVKNIHTPVKQIHTPLCQIFTPPVKQIHTKEIKKEINRRRSRRRPSQHARPRGRPRLKQPRRKN